LGLGYWDFLGDCDLVIEIFPGTVVLSMTNSDKATVISHQRLDQFVAENFGLSRSQAVKKIQNNLVRCNDEVVKKASKKLKSGDMVSLQEEKVIEKDPSPKKFPIPHSPFPILYEDTSCFVISKPAGIAVHPADSHNEPTVVDILKETTGRDPHLAHRLDKGTSGCLLVALSPQSCEALQKQFKDRTISKQYLAIVTGVPEPREATIDAPVGRSLLDRTKMSLFRTGKSREASTTYRVLSESQKASLLQCDIHTGRTHQIRVHLSAIGHPILGDEKYASEESRKISKELGIEQPCLHAEILEFTSPATSEKVQVKARVPETFWATMKKFGLKLS